MATARSSFAASTASSALRHRLLSRPEPQVLRELLGDGRGAAGEPADAQVVLGRVAHRAPVDPLVAEEVRVLGEEHRLHEPGRDPVEPDPGLTRAEGAALLLRLGATLLDERGGPRVLLRERGGVGERRPRARRAPPRRAPRPRRAQPRSPPQRHANRHAAQLSIGVASAETDPRPRATATSTATATWTRPSTSTATTTTSRPRPTTTTTTPVHVHDQVRAASVFSDRERHAPAGAPFGALTLGWACEYLPGARTKLEPGPRGPRREPWPT